MSSLYDVFCAVRDDECDHVSTMHACLDPTTNLGAPSREKKIFNGLVLASAVGYYLSMGGVSTDVADVAGDALLEDGSAATGFVEPFLAGMASFFTTIAEIIGLAL
jgi:hypothetical protein